MSEEAFHTLAILLPAVATGDADELARSIARDAIGEKGWMLMPVETPLTKIVVERVVRESEQEADAIEAVDADRGLVRVHFGREGEWRPRIVRVALVIRSAA